MNKLCFALAVTISTAIALPSSAATRVYELTGTPFGQSGVYISGQGTLTIPDGFDLVDYGGGRFQFNKYASLEFIGTRADGSSDRAYVAFGALTMDRVGSDPDLGPGFLIGGALGGLIYNGTSLPQAMNKFGTEGLFDLANWTGVRTAMGFQEDKPIPGQVPLSDSFRITSIRETAAVPEPATWAMMVLGFGAVGYAMRRKTVLRVA